MQFLIFGLSLLVLAGIRGTNSRTSEYLAAILSVLVAGYCLTLPSALLALHGLVTL